MSTLPVVAVGNLGADFDLGSRVSQKINLSWAISPTWTGTHTFSAGINIKDTQGSAFPAGIVTEVGGQLLEFGINDSRFGTQVTTSQGGFFRLDSRSGQNVFQVYTRAAGATALVQALAVDQSGNMVLAGSATLGASPATTDSSTKAATTACVDAKIARLTDAFGNPLS